MLQPYHGKIRNIVCLFVHSGSSEDDGNRIYEIAAAVIAPDRPEETFSSLVRYGKTTERDRYASGISREVLRTAPTRADVTAFLSSLLRETDVLLTLNPREQIENLLAGCGNPRVVDLRFAAEFFLPRADSAALKPLWEHLHGKPREKYSFTAREAVELSLDLVRHIGGRVLNPAEFPPRRPSVSTWVGAKPSSAISSSTSTATSGTISAVFSIRRWAGKRRTGRGS